MAELSSAATAAGTRENILVVASNSNSEALLAEAAAAVAISPINGTTKGASLPMGSKAGNAFSSVANFYSQQQSQMNISEASDAKGSTSKGSPSSASLTPNSATLYGPSMTANSQLHSNIQAAISQASSRSSLCTPRSSTSLLSSNDIDMLIDIHSISSSGGNGHSHNHAAQYGHHHHHQHSHQQQQHPAHYATLQPQSQHQQHPSNYATAALLHHQLPPHHPSLPVIGTPASFLTADVARRSLHLAATASTANQASGNALEGSTIADSINGTNSLPYSTSHASRQLNNNRLFLDVVNNNINNNSSSNSGNSNLNASTAVKMRNKTSVMNAAAILYQQQQQHQHQQSNASTHHLQHSYSNSSMHQHSPSNTQHNSLLQRSQMANQQANFNSIGMPPSTASPSFSSNTNSAQFGHQQQNYQNASLPQLITDYEDYFANNAKVNALRNSSYFNNSSSAAAHPVPASFSSLFLNQFRNKSGSFSASTDSKNDFESLYRKYADLDNFHSEVVSKLSMQVAENQTLQKRIEELLKSNQNLQQQRQSDFREIEQLKVHLESVKKQRDDANKECKNAIVSKSKAIKEKQRMYEERNTALHEYNLIMSERDSVHKEIERLNEDLGNIARRSETLEKENKSYSEEVESLKRELSSALMDRDQALRMCSDLKQQQQHSIYGTIERMGSGHGQHNSGHGYYSTETATAESSSSSLQLGHHQTVSPTQHLDQHYHHNQQHSLHHRVGSPSGLSSHHLHQHSYYQSKEPLRATLKGINYLSNSSMSSAVSSPFKTVSTDANDQQLMSPSRNCSSPLSKSATDQTLLPTESLEQTEAFRKQFDRLQIELQEAYQEIEVCKKRRDWAFSERDKIVQERESIRTLCDKLRRERDRKVSDLAEALRESDEIKRQKNETVKELQELKEKFDFTKSNSSDVMTTSSAVTNQQHLTQEVTVNPKTDFSCQATPADFGASTVQTIVTNGNYFGLPDCELIEVHLKRKSITEEWGFKMKVDDAFDIIISSLLSGASSQLRVYDQLVAINDVQVVSLLTANVEKTMFFDRAESLLRKSGLEMRLQLRRRRLVRTVQNVCLPVPASDQSHHHGHADFLDKSFLQQFGFDAECALIVNRVNTHSKSHGNSAHAGRLDTGDRIIAINGNSLNNLFGKSLVHFMMQQPNGAQAQVVRFVPNRWATGADSAFLSSITGHYGAGQLSICVDEQALPSLREVPPMMTPPPPPPMYLLEAANPLVPQHSSHLQAMSYHVPSLAISPPPPPPPPPLMQSPNMQTYGEHSTFANHHQPQPVQTPIIVLPPCAHQAKESSALQSHFSPMTTSEQFSGHLYSSARHHLAEQQPHSQQPTQVMTSIVDESKASLQKAEENLAMKTMQSVSLTLSDSQHLHLLQLQEHQKQLLEQQHKQLQEQQRQQQLQLQQELRQQNEQRQQKLHLLQQQQLLKQKQLQLLNEQTMQLEAENSAALGKAPGLSTKIAITKHSKQLVDCSSSDEEEDRSRMPPKGAGVLDNENDADADDDASTTTATNTSDTATEDGEPTYVAPEDIALAKFDKVLDQYQVMDSNTDYYGSTVTNSSVSSLTVMPPLLTSIEEVTATPKHPMTTATTSLKSHSNCQSQQAESNATTQQQHAPPSGSTVVRRSSRHSSSSKKSRSQRRTLGATQMAEAAHELTLALSETAAAAAAITSAAQSSNYYLSPSEQFSAGDTWPRYRPPHQLLLSNLPAFYQNHGEELQEIYLKKGPAAAAIAAVNSTTAFQQAQQLQSSQHKYGDHLNYLTNIHHPRRKLRKSLGANFNDLFSHKSTTTSSNLPAEQLLTPELNSSLGTSTSNNDCLSTNNGPINATVNSALQQVVMRRSPRISSSTPVHQSDHLNATVYGVIGIPFEHHQMVQQNQSGQHSTAITTSKTLNRDHLRQTMPASVIAASTAASSRASGHFSKAISSIEQSLPPPPLPPGANYSSSGASHSARHFQQMEAEAQKLEALYRSSNYSSIKLPKSIGSSAGSAVTSNNYSGPHFNSTSNALVVSDEGTPNTAIVTGRSSYSPIYATYSSSSSYRRPTVITSFEASPSSAFTSASSTGNSAALYQHGSMPGSKAHQQQQQQQSLCSSIGGTSVDYSVVSAQSQDKDVLKYYKTRHSSGSSQTGVPPPLMTANESSLSALLNAPSPHTSTSAPMTSLSVSDAAAAAAAASSAVLSGHQRNSASQSVSRSHHLLPEDLYGSLSTARSGAATSSVGPGAVSFSSGHTSPSVSINQLYSSSTATGSTYGSASGRAIKSSQVALANAVADIYGTVGRSSASAGCAAATVATSTAANGHTSSGGNESFYGTSASVMASAAAAAAASSSSAAQSHSSAYGLPPHLQAHLSPGGQQVLASTAARHSINLGLLSLSGSTSAGKGSSGQCAAPPQYEQHLAQHLAAASLDLYGLPGSSKTLPGKHSNTLLAISAPANPRASYKDGSYSHRVSPSLYLPYSSTSATYDTAVQHGPSRSASINNSQLTATLGQQQQQQLFLQQQQQQQQSASYQQHLSPERSSIYGSLFVKNVPNGGTADEVAHLSNFEENFGLALNLIGPSAAAVASSSSPGGQSSASSRLGRLRVLSSGGTGNQVVDTSSRDAHNSAGLSVLEQSGRHSATATMINSNSAYSSLQPPSSLTSSSGLFYGGGASSLGSGQSILLHQNHYHHLPSSVASCGDRSSLVSSTGLPQAPLEIKWIRCTKDGSPGSPILDASQAKADDYRLISIERSTALLGIQILKTNKCKGVFVKRVTEGSLAAQAGIQVGDQIIDICGINMRTADFENAAKVLKQCGDPIQMLVQYQYDKFKEIWSSMTEAERCNSLDSVGNACNSSTGSAHPSVLGTGRSSVEQSRRSADLMTEEELNEHLGRGQAHRLPIIGPSSSLLAAGAVARDGDCREGSSPVTTASASTSSHYRYASALVNANGAGGTTAEGHLSNPEGISRAIRRGSSRRSTVVSAAGVVEALVSTSASGNSNSSSTAITSSSLGAKSSASTGMAPTSSSSTSSATCASSGLVIYHSRHSTLTSDDITSTSTASAASTLTRRPKVASLPHECSLLSNSPTSTSNEDQSSHHSVTTTTTTSASSSQANMSTLPGHYSCQLPGSSSVFGGISAKHCDASSTRALHGSSTVPLFGSSPPSATSTQFLAYHEQHDQDQDHDHEHEHEHHGRNSSLSPSAIKVGGSPSSEGDGYGGEETISLSMSTTTATSTANQDSETSYQIAPGKSAEEQPHQQPHQQHPSPTASEAAAVATANIDKEEFDQYRSILIENTTSSLGISLVGGNAIGIFVHQVRDEQLLSYGLAPGDQIIEYNGNDLRHSTAEEAAIELAKPTDVIKMVVYYNPKRYQQIQETTIGDSFYIRVAFDRPSIDGSLGFQKNSVLYIDNTMYQGEPGVWGAWSVNALGEKEKFGVIPSKYKAEEELMMKRCYDSGSTGNNSTSNNGTSNNSTGNSSNSNPTSCMGSSNRRSFFRRRKNGSGSGNAFSTLAGAIHFRSSSRDSTSKEIACYSDLASLRGPSHVSADGEEGEAVETPLEYPVPATYIKVKKLHYDFPRPVIIIGPLKEMFIEKLEQDFPYVFQRCIADVVIQEEASITQDFFDYWMEKEKLFDARRRGSYVECTTYSSVKKICDHNLHPLLDINQNKAVKRLSANNFYPIVVFLKFKSTKQIKEINRCPTEKLSSKAAKEIYEHSCKIEIELKEQINVTIAGNNLSYMCTQIKKHVDLEQQRALWM